MSARRSDLDQIARNHGAYREYLTATRECPTCKGSGLPSLMKRWFWGYRSCPTCAGGGRLPR